MAFILSEKQHVKQLSSWLCFIFIQMKPDVEIFFSDIVDIVKKQSRQLNQVIDTLWTRRCVQAILTYAPSILD